MLMLGRSRDVQDNNSTSLLQRVRASRLEVVSVEDKKVAVNESTLEEVEEVVDDDEEKGSETGSETGGAWTLFT